MNLKRGMRTLRRFYVDRQIFKIMGYSDINISKIELHDQMSYKNFLKFHLATGMPLSSIFGTKSARGNKYGDIKPVKEKDLLLLNIRTKEAIRREMRKENLTIAKLAEKVHLNKETLNSLLNKPEYFSIIEKVNNLVEYLRIDYDDLLKEPTLKEKFVNDGNDVDLDSIYNVIRRKK